MSEDRRRAPGAVPPDSSLVPSTSLRVCRETLATVRLERLNRCAEAPASDRTGKPDLQLASRLLPQAVASTLLDQLSTPEPRPQRASAGDRVRRPRSSIPGRFNGPLESGNGGYCSGVVASFLEGAAEVSLRPPVPLDTPFDVVREDDGSVRVLDGETLVVEARSAPEFGVEVPAPVSPHEARLAAGRYRGRDDGVFSRCFVCGRACEDSFGVFAGAVEGRQLVASPWTPPSWTADADGRVLPEFVWAVLDCPTYFALYTSGALPHSMLARLAGRVDAPVVAGEEHVVIAWPLEADGRKRHAGSAVLSADGEVLAAARALLIEPRAG